MILPFILALIVSIVIVINPVEAKRGGHGHDHSDGPGNGNGHDHGDDGDDDGDDGDNGGGHTNGGNGNGNGNGKSKPSRDRDGGGECASVDGVNPCITARPKRDPNPTEIAPGVFQYYNAFGQVIGTAIITLTDPTSSPEPELIVPRETLTSSPELEPKVVEPEPAKAQPVAIVKKAAQDPEHEKAQVVRKRTIQPAEKSGDQILDVLILQALERADPEPVPVPVQSVPACGCATE